jgi:hypothetical protein
LASWVSSVLLLILCVGSIQVYLIRRFKADDYKGRYKIWLWVAAIAAVLSFEQATGAHRLLQSVVDRFATAAPWNQASLWWMMIVSVVASYVGIRLFFELSSNLGSFALFVLTAMVYGVVVCSRWESMLGASYLTSAEGQSVSLLGANLLMTTVVWIYARTVYLSAQGGRQAAMISSTRDDEFGVDAKNIEAVAMVAADESVMVQDEDDFEEQDIADDELDAEVEDWDDFDEVDEEVDEAVEEEVEEEVEYDEYESNSLEEDEEVQDEYEVYEEQPDEHQAEQSHDEYEDVLEQEMQAEYAESLVMASDSEIDPCDYADAGEYADALEAAARASKITPAFASSVQGVAEGDDFNEDAFWSGYDLTKMSRKQLRKMRKKLARLKRQHIAGHSNFRAA